MQALTQALETRLADADAGVAERRGRIEAELGRQSQERVARLRDMSMSQPADPAWISHCLNEVIGENAVVMCEAQLDLSYLERTQPRTMFGGASGLSWGLGGAVGAKLANPDRLVVAADGGRRLHVWQPCFRSFCRRRP